MLFETVISVENAHHTLPIPFDEQNIDKLNYLQQKKIQEINQTAETGTRMAHIDGGVPNLRIVVPEICEEILGELIYFFEFSCALGGYLYPARRMSHQIRSELRKERKTREERVRVQTVYRRRNTRNRQPRTEKYRS